MIKKPLRNHKLIIDNKYNEYIKSIILKIANDIGPREPGSENEKKCAEFLESELKKFCNGTKIEPFKFTIAFLAFLKISILTFIIAIIFYWFIPLISIIIILFTWFAIIMEYFRYREFLDKIFRKRESQNVIGVINPKSMEDIKNILIISSHHDTVHDKRTFIKSRNKRMLLARITIFTAFFPLFCSILKYIFTGFQFFSIPSFIGFDFIFSFLGIILLIPIPIAGFIFKFFNFRPVLGISDNMMGIAIALGFAKFLREHENDEIFPKNTQIKIMSFGAEEAGLRGSRNYVKEHFGEISQYETVAINFHLVSCKNLLLIKEEKSLRVMHSMEVVEDLTQHADIENKLELYDLPFGGTSAFRFSKNKIKAVTIANKHIYRFIDKYGTKEDILEKIDDEPFLDLLSFLIHYLKYFDSLT